MDTLNGKSHKADTQAQTHHNTANAYRRRQQHAISDYEKNIYKRAYYKSIRHQNKWDNLVTRIVNILGI